MADTLNEQPVLQVFNNDVKFIYWWIFILGCCTFGLAFPSAMRYWRAVADSAFDTKAKNAHKRDIICYSAFEVMNLVVVTLPLRSSDEISAMRLDDVMETKRCSLLSTAFLYTAYVAFISRLCYGVILGRMAKGAKRSRAMAFVYAALSMLTFVVLAIFIMSPFTFVPKGKTLTLGSYIWIVILVSNVLGRVLNTLQSWLSISYAAAAAAPEAKLKQLRARAARSSAIMTIIRFTPFLLPLLPPVLGVEFHTGITWMWLILSYQFFDHFSVISLMILMTKLIIKKNRSTGDAASPSEESSEALLGPKDDESSDKELVA